MAEDQLVPPTLPPAEDWPAKASSTVTQYVGLVRDKTTGPALVASRNAVYLLAIGLIAIVFLILLLVVLVRLLVSATALLPFMEPGETWLTYFIIGTLFLFAGAFAWRKKEA